MKYRLLVVFTMLFDNSQQFVEYINFIMLPMGGLIIEKIQKTL